jgi:hypothetical protein
MDNFQIIFGIFGISFSVFSFSVFSFSVFSFSVFSRMNPEVFVKEMKDVHQISVNAIQEICNKTNETILKLYTAK